MKKILIIYGSTMGNTEKLAEKIISELKSEEINIFSKNVTDATVDDFLEYNILLFGSSTWGDGDLQDDFADFLPKLESIELKGKKGAVFGPGDSNYDKFCEAVNIIENSVKNCGLSLYVNGLKIDGEIEDSEDLIHEWIHDLRLSIMND
jgi:flavodoxin I